MMRGIARQMLWIGLLVGLMTLVCAQGDDDLPPPDLVFEAPEAYLILEPGEKVTFVVTPFDEKIAKSFEWYALTGTILDVSSDGFVTYQAPDDANENFDIIMAYNAETKEYIALSVTTVCETEPVEVEEEDIDHGPIKLRGYRVPTATNAPGYQVFQVGSGSLGQGVTICLRQGRPLNPRPRRCLAPGRFTTTSKKYYSTDPVDVRIGRITIDAELQERLRRRNIHVSLGAVYEVTCQKTIETEITLVDCYECRNGVPVLVGSRASFVRKITYTGPSPHWASWLGFRCPQPGRPQTKCVSVGDCPCP